MILSKGFKCIMHIHTYNDEIEISDILKSTEINKNGEIIEKVKPNFARK